MTYSELKQVANDHGLLVGKYGTKAKLLEYLHTALPSHPSSKPEEPLPAPRFIIHYLPDGEIPHHPPAELPADLIDPMESIYPDDETELAVSLEIKKNQTYPLIDMSRAISAGQADNGTIVSFLEKLVELMEFMLLDAPAESTGKSGASGSSVEVYRQRYLNSVRLELPNIDETRQTYDDALLKRGHTKTSLTMSIRQIRTAISAMKVFPDAIKSGAEISSGPKKIAGVGPGIAARVDEIIITKDLRELHLYKDTQAANIISLTTVHGIGSKKALDLTKKYGLKGINDLLERFRKGTISPSTGGFTTAMCSYLRWYEDLQKRIPYGEVREINHLLQQVIKHVDPKLSGIICGSHRRLRPNSGDVDFLLVHPDLRDDEAIIRSRLFEKIVNTLIDIGFLVENLNYTWQTKYFGICQLRSDSTARRIDILFIGRDEFAPALMYFTGSGNFNQMVRSRANQLGYTLNEHGLYHYLGGTKGDRVPVHSENDIFRVLRINHLNMQPPKREYGKGKA